MKQSSSSKLKLVFLILSLSIIASMASMPFITSYCREGCGFISRDIVKNDKVLVGIILALAALFIPSAIYVAYWEVMHKPEHDYITIAGINIKRSTLNFAAYVLYLLLSIRAVVHRYGY